MAKKKFETKPIIIETPLEENNEGQLITKITESDIINNPELKELEMLPDDVIEVKPENIHTFEQPDQIDEDPLLLYINEFLTSLEGIYIGGHASQKRDQLIEYLNKR
jgi:hypothetical protein